MNDESYLTSSVFDGGELHADAPRKAKGRDLLNRIDALIGTSTESPMEALVRRIKDDASGTAKHSDSCRSCSVSPVRSVVDRPEDDVLVELDENLRKWLP